MLHLIQPAYSLGTILPGCFDEVLLRLQTATEPVPIMLAGDLYIQWPEEVLLSVQGQLLRQLQAFANTAQPSYLPSFTQRAQDFHEGVQALVYDVLMLKVLMMPLSSVASFYVPYLS